MTTSRASSPRDYIAKNFKGKNVAHPARQVDLRQRPRRRDQEGAQQGRHQGKDVTRPTTRTTRTSPRSSPPEARQHRSRLSRRLSSGRRPADAADARSGPEDRDDGAATRSPTRNSHRSPARPPKARCSPSVPTRATSRPPRPWSTSSRPRTSIRKATRSTPTPRCRCGRRPPRRPTRPTSRRSPKPSRPEPGTPCSASSRFDAKGDIKVIDYVVYKFDAKGNYAEIPGKGS